MCASCRSRAVGQGLETAWVTLVRGFAHMRITTFEERDTELISGLSPGEEMYELS